MNTSVPTSATRRHLAGPLAVLGALTLTVAACVGAGSSATPTTGGSPSSPVPIVVPPAASASAPSASATSDASGAGPLVPAPSGPGASALESMLPVATPPAAAGATHGGGQKGTNLIECVGPTQGPPCVPASQVLYVVAAEKALPSSTLDTIRGAAFTAGGPCPPSAACPAAGAPVGTVTFRSADGTQTRVFVYRTGNGSLAAVQLP